MFSVLEGVDATASTRATIPVAAYNNVSQTMTITLNGLNFSATDPTAAPADQLIDIGTQINQSALVGVTAVINGGGDLRLFKARALIYCFYSQVAQRIVSTSSVQMWVPRP